MNHEFLLGATENLPGVRKTSRKDGCVDLRHGRNKKLRTGVQEICEFLASMITIELESVDRIVKSMLTNCLEMLVLGTILADLTFCEAVEHTCTSRLQKWAQRL